MSLVGRLIGIGCFCLLANAGHTQKLSFEYEASIRSGYVWRGIVLDGKPAVQSSTTALFGPLSFNVWSTGRTLRAAVLAGSDEVDYGLSYEANIGSVGLTHSLTFYSYSSESGNENSIEAGLGATLEVAGLTLFANQYLDIWAASGGFYSELGAAHERDLSEAWSLDATVTLGWGSSAFNAYNLGVARSAWNAVACEIGFTYRLKRGFYLRPSLAASMLIDRQLRDAAERPDNLIFGIAFGFGG